MDMNSKETTIFYPENSVEWRRWLEENHLKEQAVWVVFYTKSSGKPTMTWSEAVDEALCFGWIDSKVTSMGDGRLHQFFSKRKAKSTWSKINKEKIERLTADGLMKQAGYESIERAKENGSWTILDEVEELVVPKDFEDALGQYEEAMEYFLGLSKSVKKMMLYWLVSAKRPETRQKRIDELAEHASRKSKPKQF
jgi:uncharacterized protein YdeI (YjbR/CyaY-like superfamily)